MIPAPIVAWLAKPAVKYGAIAVVALALIGGGFALYHSILSKGEKAGAAAVTTKVQETTIRKIDDARVEKEKANEAVRNAPLDAVIDGLR